LKVLVAGATGAIGRALVPRLLAAGHEVVALTRSPEKAAALGARPAVADVYDAAAVRTAVAEARPDAVIDQLTDLGGGSPLDRRTFAANDRMRLEGSPNVLAAARAAGVERYLVQSVAFFAQGGEGRASEDVPLAVDSPLADGVRAVASLEAGVREAGGTILRYGRASGCRPTPPRSARRGPGACRAGSPGASPAPPRSGT
jgi:2-alkyl-3-oxoalkanoate reductase